MVVIPELKNYDINVLIALGNQTGDVVVRNKIKLLIVEKIIDIYCYSPMFFFINKFISCNRILKEAYAEVITMKMKDNKYYINDSMIDEILQYVSLDALMYYGADSASLEFSKKCKEEFDNRAKQIEDKIELNKKKNLGKKKILRNNRKGD